MTQTNLRYTLANNCRALTEDELSFMNMKYEFWFDDNHVCVKCKNRKRITLHDKHNKFSINIKHVRKITITKFAIELYEDFLSKDAYKKYTLLDIQNALNVLRLTYQLLNRDNMINLLMKNKRK